jgi:tetratricopeptide (TPR) repeat protein
MNEVVFRSLKQRVEAIKKGDSFFASDLTEIGNFAIDLLQEGAVDCVLDLLEPLKERAHNIPLLWHVLSMSYRALQRTSEALEAIRRAKTLDPNNPKLATLYALISFEAGERSSPLFKIAQTLAPDDIEIQLSASAALAVEGNSRAAESVLERLIIKSPSLVRAHDALSALRHMHYGKENFDKSYAKSVASHPQDLALRLAWYRALSQVKLYEKAEKAIAEGRHIFGDRPEFDAIEAHHATENGYDDKAERLFKTTHALNDPGTQISVVRHCLRTGQIEKAETIALSLTQTPVAPAIWPYLGLIWRIKGDERALWLDRQEQLIGIYDLEYSKADLDALAHLLRRLHVSQYHPPEQSMRNGTQTEGNLFLRINPEIRLIRERIVEAVNSYIQGLPPIDLLHPLLRERRDKILFSGSWSVRLTQQGFHICHTHQEGWISSAFYVSLPEKREMGDAPAGWLELGAPPADLRINLPAYKRVEPKLGRLVLFPSTMWHSTIPFNDGERLTIAFDVMPMR